MKYIRLEYVIFFMKKGKMVWFRLGCAKTVEKTVIKDASSIEEVVLKGEFFNNSNYNYA